MPGRPRLSNQEKALKGTLQKCRVNAAAPKSELPDRVRPTVAIKGISKKVWERSLRFLKKNDLMGDADIDLLTSYCAEMGEYFELRKKAEEIEKENERLTKEYKATDPPVDELVDFMSKLPRPDRWRRMSGNAYDRALKASDRFGFSPLMRQKLSLPNGEEEEDIMSKFLTPTFRGEAATA